jgi:3-isopropylmalate/(R)-2-methylmalate dehydratase small subunit
MNIGILPVQVSDAFLNKIFQAIEADPNALVEVDLPEQKVTIVSTGEYESFDINGYKKHNLMNGFDDIDYLQAMKSEIMDFAEKSRY